MTDRHQPDHEHPRLGTALRRITDARIEVPPAIDASVLADARRSVRSSAVAGRRGRRRVVGWSLLAASVGLVTWIGVQVMAPPGAPHTEATMARGEQPVTILDAFRLARQLDAGERPSAPDVNGDGRVDHADVEALAVQSVRLSTEVGS